MESSSYRQQKPGNSSARLSRFVMADMGEFWVFGYGSLMWRPGFEHAEQMRAKISGYRRSLCIVSQVHRGTPEKSGLVLGLDRGGSCVGVAFRVDTGVWSDVIAYLRERELVTNAYIERVLPVRLSDGRQIKALTYVVDRGHPQYAGSLHPEVAASRVVGRTGQSGSNEEYVFNTVEHLKALGIRDLWLESVARLIV
jgi:glutathione-specific gamma-glutamylcyclotransferase